MAGEGRFEGKVVIVTGGGGGGIGGACVKRFAGEGAHVLAVDINAAGAERVAAEAVGLQGKVRVCISDITTDQGVADMVAAAVREFGRLDVVVNNATSNEVGPILGISEAGWQQTFDGNVTAVWRSAKHATPVMAKTGGGVFVNISSNAALAAIPGLAAYGAAKAAMISLTRQIAVECAAQHIRANSITPGVILSPGIVSALEHHGREKVLAAMVNGFGEPDEVARVVLFLASDDSAFVNGENIQVDGGWFATQHLGGMTFGVPSR